MVPGFALVGEEPRSGYRRVSRGASIALASGEIGFGPCCIVMARLHEMGLLQKQAPHPASVAPPAQICGLAL
jgi:hypothetical protein